MIFSASSLTSATGHKFYQSIYFKIFISLLVVSLCCEVLRFGIAIHYSRLHAAKVEEQVNWNTATQAANQLQPLIRRGLLPGLVEPLANDLQLVHPGARLYLLNSVGKVVYPRQFLVLDHLDLNPIVKSMSIDIPDWPLFADDPQSKDRKTIFSAAQIRIGEHPGYIYITAHSLLADTLTTFKGMQSMAKNLLGSMLFSTITMILIASLLLFYLSRHFRELLRIVRRFEKGQFEERPDIKSGDEMEFLSQTVNHMADAIVSRQQSLEKLSKQRRDLIANIAHDLRGPLTSIAGFLEILSSNSRNLDKREVVNCLEIISRNTSLEQELLENLQELSNLEAKERAPAFESFSLLGMVDGLVLTLSPEAEKKGLRLKLEASADTPKVWGDRLMISRVITNLVGNAIRYTARGGEVRLELLKQETSILVRISDTGIGIPAEELPYIFDEFFRANKGHKEDPGGTGLGLAIVKRIIELHQSSIKVESVVGQGTKFSFDLSVHGSC